MTDPAPRLFCVPASRAPVLAVIRRGPSDWSHLGAWDPARNAYTPGAWIHAHLYAQRSDLSPDGRWFASFTLKPSARWDVGATYVAISRLPWLTALAAWSTCGTWTRGIHFVEDREVWQVSEPEEGDITPCRRAFGLAVTRAASFQVERRRGWTETAGSPPFTAADPWEIQRGGGVRVEKPRPGSGGATRLVAGGGFAAFRESREWWKGAIAYALVDGDATVPLADVQWADWDATGRLLVATRDGRLQVREGAGGRLAVAWEIDLAPLRPEPTAPPAEAQQW